MKTFIIVVVSEAETSNPTLSFKTIKAESYSSAVDWASKEYGKIFCVIHPSLISEISRLFNEAL